MNTAGLGLQPDAEVTPPPASDETDGIVSALFEKYNQALHRFLFRRLDSVEEAAELAQEVYLRIVQYSRQHEIAYPRAFLFKTARNLLVDHERKQHAHQTDQHISADEMELTSPYPNAEELVQSKQLFQFISKVLDELKPEARQAFVLHRFKGWKYKKIASEMGVSTSVVGHHISDVMAQVDKKLRGYL
ncbi:MAG: RNA polymerase sigma factor [Deltaproteobacteria bacterium]|nr:RNA polymerase sigma factor [Deltaproteobacteria bacterium]